MKIEKNIKLFQPGDSVIYNPVGYNISTATQRPHDHGYVIKFDGYYVHMKTYYNKQILRVLYPSINHYPPKENLEKRIHITI